MQHPEAFTLTNTNSKHERGQKHTCDPARERIYIICDILQSPSVVVVYCNGRSLGRVDYTDIANDSPGSLAIQNRERSRFRRVKCSHAIPIRIDDTGGIFRAYARDLITRSGQTGVGGSRGPAIRARCACIRSGTKPTHASISVGGQPVPRSEHGSPDISPCASGVDCGRSLVRYDDNRLICSRQVGDSHRPTHRHRQGGFSIGCKPTRSANWPWICPRRMYRQLNRTLALLYRNGLRNQPRMGTRSVRTYTGHACVPLDASTMSRRVDLVPSRTSHHLTCRFCRVHSRAANVASRIAHGPSCKSRCISCCVIGCVRTSCRRGEQQ
jgi:hypothetical protein